MPHRSDKQDYLALMSLVSHLDIEFVDGVNGSLIHPNALPAVCEPHVQNFVSFFLTSFSFGQVNRALVLTVVGVRI
jgi:hypothetical protein